MNFTENYLNGKGIRRSVMGITLEGVNYTYQAGTPFEGRALFDINLTIKEGSYTAFIGHTGSGKVNNYATFKWS